jgi:predicted dehydrogenase
VRPDHTHCRVVVEALDAGLNVVVDKPLATSVWECDRILAAMERAGRQVIVGHNARYHAWTLKACRMVRAGQIGPVLQVEAGEVLSYSHGGDYFHRWHSDFSKSAGLLTHKCCHHLDVLSWILDDDPVEVSAWGGRSFYRPRPDLNHGQRCTDCAIAGDCPHAFDMDKWDGVRRRIYMGAEAEDGYIRDRCCFSDRHTINDHETLHIRYGRGTLASFTNLAFAPKEYSYIYLTGMRGRLELQSRDPKLRIYRESGQVEDVDFAAERGEHGHGGADVKLIADVLGLPGSDPLQRAHPREARRAVLIADLANRSIAAGGRPVRAEEAGKDYPPPPRGPEP